MTSSYDLFITSSLLLYSCNRYLIAGALLNGVLKLFYVSFQFYYDVDGVIYKDLVTSITLLLGF